MSKLESLKTGKKIEFQLFLETYVNYFFFFVHLIDQRNEKEVNLLKEAKKDLVDIKIVVDQGIVYCLDLLLLFHQIS